MSAPAQQPPLPPSLPEEVFDRYVTWLEKKANPRAERFFKSKVLLAPCGLFWTAWARSYLAMRDLKPSRLIKRPDVDVVKGIAKEGAR
jgi:hypothetical protein